jgi:hypothetical protein
MSIKMQKRVPLCEISTGEDWTLLIEKDDVSCPKNRIEPMRYSRDTLYDFRHIKGRPCRTPEKIAGTKC